MFLCSTFISVLLALFILLFFFFVPLLELLEFAIPWNELLFMTQCALNARNIAELAVFAEINFSLCYSIVKFNKITLIMFTKN